jgi:hypothetical protein
LPRPVAAVLVAAYLVDMLAFRWMSDKAVPRLPPTLSESLASLPACPLDFCDRRTDRLPQGRVPQGERLLAFMDPKCVSGAREGPYEPPYVFGVKLNQLSYAFLRHDPCESRYFVPIRMRNVDNLLGSRGWDPAFGRVLGCEAPKLRLVPQAIFVEGEARAYGIVKTTPAIDEVVVIPRPSSAGEATPSSAPAADAGEVRVLGFSANSLELGVRPVNHIFKTVYGREMMFGAPS